jgi:transcriptional regulatory protein LevR
MVVLVVVETIKVMAIAALNTRLNRKTMNPIRKYLDIGVTRRVNEYFV